MRKYFILLLCISAVLLLFGCWSSKEPKELAIVDSSLYDKKPDGTYVVYSEAVNPQGLGGAGNLGGVGGNKNPYITFTGSGPSIREAIVDQAQNREMIDFGAHNKARFLSESFARDDMGSFMDMITRENLTDEKPFLIVIKGDDPERIYDSMIGTSSIVGDFIEGLSKHQPRDIGTGVFVTTLEFIRDFYTEGKEPVAGLLTISEFTDKPSGNTKLSTGEGGTSSLNYGIIYEGLAAFKEGKLVGLMDRTCAQAYNFIENKIQTAYFTVPVGNGDSTVVDIIYSNADIKSDIIDGKAIVNVTIKASAKVSQEGGEIDVTKSSGEKTIEEALNSEMEEQILKAVKKAQTEFKSDIFGFGEFLNIQHMDKWKEVADNWNDDYFANAEVNVTVKTDIVSTGKIEKPFKMEGAD